MDSRQISTILASGFAPTQIGSISTYIEPVTPHTPLREIQRVFQQWPDLQFIPVEQGNGPYRLIPRGAALHSYPSVWAQIIRDPMESMLQDDYVTVDALEHVEQVLARASRKPGHVTTDFLVVHRRKYFGVVSLSTILRHVSYLRSEELERARIIQQHLMSQWQWDSDLYSVEFFFDLAYELGGDFYFRLQLQPEQELIACFDVSGKNISAALSTSTIAAFFATLEKRDQLARLSSREMVELLNNVLCAETPVDMFVAAILIFVNAESRCLEIFNHGYSPLYVITPADNLSDYSHLHVDNPLFSSDHPDKGAGEKGVERIVAQFPPLGIEERLDESEQALSMGIRSGLRLFSCSDGLFDAQSPYGRAFGQYRLERLLSATREMRSSDVVPTLKRLVGEFVADAPRVDDITAFHLEFL